MRLRQCHSAGRRCNAEPAAIAFVFISWNGGHSPGQRWPATQAFCEFMSLMKNSVHLSRWLIALLALSGVIISYIAIVPAAHVTRLRLTTNFLSYFTIQTNIILAVLLLSAEIAPSSAIGQFARRPSTKTALLMYACVAGGVYIWMLKAIWRPSGWQLWGDQILHYGVPALVVLDWIFLVRHGELAWRDALLWLAFPAIYSIYSLIHGYFSRFYPYPFLHVGEIGLQSALVNMTLLGTMFLALGGILILMDRALARFGDR